MWLPVSPQHPGHPRSIPPRRLPLINIPRPPRSLRSICSLCPTHRRRAVVTARDVSRWVNAVTAAPVRGSLAGRDPPPRRLRRSHHLPRRRRSFLCHVRRRRRLWLQRRLSRDEARYCHRPSDSLFLIGTVVLGGDWLFLSAILSRGRLIIRPGVELARSATRWWRRAEHVLRLRRHRREWLLTQRRGRRREVGIPLFGVQTSPVEEESDGDEDGGESFCFEVS
jgi:hypothetical protein